MVLVTHFMDEAQRLCDRLAVLVDGRVAAQGTPTQLVNWYGGGTRVRFSAPAGHELPDLDRVPGVLSVSRQDGRVEMRGAGPFLVGLGYALTKCGLGSVDLTVDQPSLEDAYVRLVAAGKDGA